MVVVSTQCLLIMHSYQNIVTCIYFYHIVGSSHTFQMMFVDWKITVSDSSLTNNMANYNISIRLTSY